MLNVNVTHWVWQGFERLLRFKCYVFIWSYMGWVLSSLVILPDPSLHVLVQTVRAAVWLCNLSSSEYYLLVRLPLSAAIKMAPFIVQLAQDHVVLEEKLVSHAKSAERNKSKELGLGFYMSRSEARSTWPQRSISGMISGYIQHHDNQKINLAWLLPD